MDVHQAKTIIELAELLIDRIFEKILNDPTIIPPESELKQVKELVIFTKEYELSVDDIWKKARESSSNPCKNFKSKEEKEFTFENHVAEYCQNQISKKEKVWLWITMRPLLFFLNMKS